MSWSRSWSWSARRGSRWQPWRPVSWTCQPAPGGWWPISSARWRRRNPSGPPGASARSSASRRCGAARWEGALLREAQRTIPDTAAALVLNQLDLPEAPVHVLRAFLDHVLERVEVRWLRPGEHRSPFNWERVAVVPRLEYATV